VNQFLRPAKKVDNRELLLGRHFEEVGHMTLRNYEDVARTQGVAVQAHIRQFILGQDGVGGAELASFTLFHRSPFVNGRPRLRRIATQSRDSHSVVLRLMEADYGGGAQWLQLATRRVGK
jgi:hypothetical protein